MAASSDETDNLQKIDEIIERNPIAKRLRLNVEAMRIGDTSVMCQGDRNSRLFEMRRLEFNPRTQKWDNQRDFDESVITHQMRDFLEEQREQVFAQIKEALSKNDYSSFSIYNMNSFRVALQAKAEEIFLHDGQVHADYIKVFEREFEQDDLIIVQTGKDVIAELFSDIVIPNGDRSDSPMEKFKYCLLNSYVSGCLHYFLRRLEDVELEAEVPIDLDVKSGSQIPDPIKKPTRHSAAVAIWKDPDNEELMGSINPLLRPQLSSKPPMLDDELLSLQNYPKGMTDRPLRNLSAPNFASVNKTMWSEGGSRIKPSNRKVNADSLTRRELFPNVDQKGKAEEESHSGGAELPDDTVVEGTPKSDQPSTQPDIISPDSPPTLSAHGSENSSVEQDSMFSNSSVAEDDPKAWASSILNGLKNLYDNHKIDKAGLESMLAVLDGLRAIDEDTWKKLDELTLWAWRQILKAALQCAFMKSHKQNLDKLIAHIETLLFARLGIVAKSWARQYIESSIASILEASSEEISESLKTLIALHQRKYISVEHFLFSYYVLQFSGDPKNGGRASGLFPDELALAKAICNMSLCSNARLKEAAFKLLKEKKISENTFIKTAAFLQKYPEQCVPLIKKAFEFLEKGSISDDTLWDIIGLLENYPYEISEAKRRLFSKVLGYFGEEVDRLFDGDSETSEDRGLSKKQAAIKKAISALREPRINLTPKERNKLPLQLCHYALWIEHHFFEKDNPFFDIAMDNLKYRYTTHELQKTAEYRYLENVKKLRHCAFQPGSSEEMRALFTVMQDFESIVQKSGFSKADKEKAYKVANMQMDKALKPGVNTDEDEKAFDEVCTQLSFQVQADKKVSSILKGIGGGAGISAGIASILWGVAGIVASTTSIFATFGLSTPVALFGIGWSIASIVTGVALIVGGATAEKAVTKRYKQANKAQEKWNTTCQELRDQADRVSRNAQKIEGGGEPASRFNTSELPGKEIAVPADAKSKVRKPVNKWSNYSCQRMPAGKVDEDGNPHVLMPNVMYIQYFPTGILQCCYLQNGHPITLRFREADVKSLFSEEMCARLKFSREVLEGLEKTDAEVEQGPEEVDVRVGAAPAYFMAPEAGSLFLEELFAIGPEKFIVPNVSGKSPIGFDEKVKEGILYTKQIDEQEPPEELNAKVSFLLSELPEITARKVKEQEEAGKLLEGKQEQEEASELREAKREQEDKGLPSQKLKEKEGEKQEERILTPALWGHTENLEERFVLPQDAPSDSIERIHTKHPLKTQGALGATSYERVKDDRKYKLENNVGSGEPGVIDPTTLIPAIKNNLEKIEEYKWVSSLHGYRNEEGRGGIKRFLEEDEALLQQCSPGSAEYGVVENRIREQKENKEAFECFLEEKKKVKQLRRANAEKNWHSSGIGPEKTQCMPILDKLDKAIKEDNLRVFDMATLLYYQKALIHLRQAHERYYALESRPTVASNIDNLNALIGRIHLEIKRQLGFFQKNSQKITAENVTIERVMSLYQENRQQLQRHPAFFLMRLYSEKKIRAEQFIFAFHIFEEESSVREKIHSLCRDENCKALVPLCIQALYNFQDKTNELMQVILYYESGNMLYEEFQLVCARLDKMKFLAAVTDCGMVGEDGTNRFKLATWLIEEKITEKEFLFAYNQLLNSKKNIVGVFIWVVESRKEPELRKKLCERLDNGQISLEIYLKILFQIPTNPKLANAMSKICDNSRDDFKEKALQLLKTGKVSEGTFIEAAEFFNKTNGMEFDKTCGILLFKDELNRFGKEVEAIIPPETESLVVTFLKDSQQRQKSQEIRQKKREVIQTIQELDRVLELSPEKESQLLLKLCRLAQWIESNCSKTDYPFFNIAMENLELRCDSRYKKVPEYQESLKALKRQRSGVVELKRENVPRLQRISADQVKIPVDSQAYIEKARESLEKNMEGRRSRPDGTPARVLLDPGTPLEGFSPELQEEAKKDFVDLYNQTVECYNGLVKDAIDELEAILRFTRGSMTQPTVDQLIKRHRGLFEKVYRYIFDGEDYTAVFKGEFGHGKDKITIDAYLKRNGLTREDLFMRYVQLYQHAVGEMLSTKYGIGRSSDNFKLLFLKLSVDFFGGEQANDPCSKACQVFFREKSERIKAEKLAERINQAGYLSSQDLIALFQLKKEVSSLSDEGKYPVICADAKERLILKIKTEMRNQLLDLKRDPNLPESEQAKILEIVSEEDENVYLSYIKEHNPLLYNQWKRHEKEGLVDSDSGEESENSTASGSDEEKGGELSTSSGSEAGEVETIIQELKSEVSGKVADIQKVVIAGDKFSTMAHAEDLMDITPRREGQNPPHDNPDGQPTGVHSDDDSVGTSSTSSDGNISDEETRIKSGLGSPLSLFPSSPIVSPVKPKGVTNDRKPELFAAQ